MAYRQGGQRGLAGRAQVRDRLLAKADDFVEASCSGWPTPSSPTARVLSRRTPTTVDSIKIAKRENIEIGQVARFEAADGNVLDAYVHIRTGVAPTP